MGNEKLQDFFLIQEVLDTKILKNHPEQVGRDLRETKVLAFLIEAGEMMNELPENFKYWSHKKNNRKKSLEEYVDLFHFLLSIGVDMNVDSYNFHYAFHNVGRKYRKDYNQPTVAKTFSSLFTSVIRFKDDMTLRNYFDMLDWLMAIGWKSGFTWDEFMREYRRKNEINHIRQDEDY